jgi:hypothetical protein
MKTLAALLLTYVNGSAPFCTYDGYNYQCYYYTWAACEQAVKFQPQARCVSRPGA